MPAGIEPCATFGTSRESYALDDFHLDLDVASFGVGEIELMCADGDEAEAAAERIGELGTRLGAEMASHKRELSSKVAMVLEAERPAQYKALKEAGVHVAKREGSAAGGGDGGGLRTSMLSAVCDALAYLRLMVRRCHARGARARCTGARAGPPCEACSTRTPCA